PLIRVLCLLIRRPPISPLFPYTTLFRSVVAVDRRDRANLGLPRIVVRRGEDDLITGAPARGVQHLNTVAALLGRRRQLRPRVRADRKSTRLNSSHVKISYAVFCLKKKIT